MFFKNKKNIIFLILIFGIFGFFNFSNAGWLGPAQCSDNTTGCGYIADLSVIENCSISGNDIVNGNRVLGGQVCYTVGGQDNGGYYMEGTGEPNINTPIFPYGNQLPPGWVSNKRSDILRIFGGSNIPLDVFQEPGLSYYNLKFFDPISINVNLPRPDDSSMLQIGSNYVYWTGCSSDPRNVFDPNCPSNNFVGSTNFNARPGDQISFKIDNHLRPNNGYGTWGSGETNITFGDSSGSLTVCYTESYFNSLCASGNSSACGRGSYIPTARGVCSPIQPRPKLDTKWIDTGTKTINLNLTQGQSQDLNFNVSNIGEPGSRMKIKSCNSNQNQTFILNLNCPTNIELISLLKSDFKLSFLNIFNFLKQGFLTNK